MENLNSKVNPLITVLMPVYNAAPYLKETIESILSQTYREFEFLIINDCSTDSSLDVIKSFSDPGSLSIPTVLIWAKPNH